MPIELLPTSITPTPHFNHLPTELVCEIFEWCLPDDTSRRESPLKLLPPWTLSWVCHEWRAVCLSTPRLWVRIQLGHYGSEPEGDTQILNLILSRTGVLLLHISFAHEVNDSLNPIVLDEDRKQMYLRGMRSLLAKTISVSHRWRAFKLHTLEASILEPILSALVIGAPQLEKLVISTKYLGFFGDIRVLDLGLCPNLRSVQLLSPKISPSPYQETLMTNMRHLHLRFCTTVEDCLRWLDMCPLLETVKVRLFSARSGVNESLSQDEQRIRLMRNLWYFEMHCFSVDQSPAVLLDLLNLPKMKHLFVYMHDMSSTDHSWSHIQYLIERSKASLEVLELWGATVTANIQGSLQCSLKLKVLSLGHSLTVDSILSSLTIRYDLSPSDEAQVGHSPDVSGITLCPGLEVLNLSDSAWSTEVLVDMVASRNSISYNNSPDRRSGPQPLLRLGVDAHTLRLVRDNAVMQACTDRGLIVDEVDTLNSVGGISSPRIRFDES